MKKTTLVIVSLFLLVNTVLIAEQEETEHKPVLEDFGGFHYACMPSKGPYPSVKGKMDAFLKEFQKQGLKAEGDFTMVYYNSPRKNKKEDLEWALSFPIAAGAKVKPPLKKAEFKKTRCVTMIHSGPLENLQESNDKVNDYVDKNGYKMVWPAYEIFNSNPRQIKIVHPVTKK